MRRRGPSVVAASTPPRGTATSRPRNRSDPPPRNIHVVAVPAEYPRGSRGGRRRQNIHVVAAASPRPSPRNIHVVAAAGVADRRGAHARVSRTAVAVAGTVGGVARRTRAVGGRAAAVLFRVAREVAAADAARTVTERVVQELGGTVDAFEKAVCHGAAGTIDRFAWFARKVASSPAQRRVAVVADAVADERERATLALAVLRRRAGPIVRVAAAASPRLCLRNIHVAAAASPRLCPRSIHVAAAASPRTRLH